MWTAEIVEANGLSKLYYVKGPKFTIGRSDEVDLAFSSEKSISRIHCEVTLSVRDNILSVKDLNSRFGTFVNDKKLVSGDSVVCTENEKIVVRLGVASWRLLLSKSPVQICSTRLEKHEKELLKKRVKLLGAVMAQQMETATHLVTNKATATVKFLYALVSSMKIVTLSWLEFSETSKPIELIPKESASFPENTEDAFLVDHTVSRNHLFTELHVILSNEIDVRMKLLI